MGGERGKKKKGKRPWEISRKSRGSHPEQAKTDARQERVLKGKGKRAKGNNQRWKPGNGRVEKESVRRGDLL